METPETAHWCSLHGGWHTDKKTAERFGRCRSCHNDYMLWRYHQSKDGLPCGIGDYREAKGIVKVPRPQVTEALTECSVCMKRPRERGAYCRGCHNAYTQWAMRRRKHARVNGRTADCSILEFQLAVDKGWVVPRYEGEPHQGRVVRCI